MDKILFLGTKEIGYECLKFLLNNEKKLNASVIGVLTNNRSINKTDKTVEELCNNNSIPIFRELDEILNLSSIDFIISVQYHQILKKGHIQVAKKLAINLHMAPLPEYRGCNQFSFSIANGDNIFGTTLHKLDSGIDNGDILVEDRFEIPSNIFVQELYKITFKKSIELFKKKIEGILNGSTNSVPQKSLFNSRKKGLYLRKDIEQLKTIDENWDIEKQKRYFRATYFPPFPPPVLKTTNGETIPLTIDWYNSL